jgi:anthranilate/para-aminobenzoate synthase component I
MRPADLEPRESFALLGPGYGGEAWTLLEDLRPGPGPLLFAGFESGGESFAARAAEVTVELDEPAHLEVALAADGYDEKIDRIRAAIAAGDVYQVCLTTRARLGAASGARLLALLCRHGVPRFAAWVRLPGGRELVSASPELFFAIADGRVRTEPMKGTATPGDGEGLAASEKDRAELAMITDLLRNDLQTVCRPGSVRVDDPRRFVHLAYAVQTVSDVSGELAPGVGPLEVLRALHPGGSVVGAPKRAALAMIRELEDEPRGAYCGALGLLSGGGAVVSLLIRTAARSASRGAGAGWVYGVGGGVVYDSDPATEIAELHTKLGVLG